MGSRVVGFVRGILLLVTIAGLIAVLVSSTPKRMVLSIVIVVLSALVIAADDASFLGGVRPFDGGDDGLFYDGVGRLILQKLLSGDLYGALEGGKKVFYYGGPGLRYFRALEHIFFGESYLGYLTIVLLFPFVVYRLFQRFLSQRWSLALILIFVAVPIGKLFGTSFVQYELWASRGFADPAAYILFIAGLMPIIGKIGERRTFLPAFFGALLVALGIFMKPIIAPAAAVLLAGAVIAALRLRQWPRLAGLCVGFLPVFSMALHNWVYGNVFVLFSANAQDLEPAGDAAVGLSCGRKRTHRSGFDRGGTATLHSADRPLVKWSGGVFRDYSVERRRKSSFFCLLSFVAGNLTLGYGSSGRRRLTSTSWRFSMMPLQPAIIS